jgi:hypothetical protein
MSAEVQLISDGDGLAVIGRSTDVERFLLSEGLPTSKDLGLPRLKSVASNARPGRVATAHCCAAAPSEPDVHDFHASGSSKPYGVLACSLLVCRLPVARRWQWVWSRRSRGS